MDTHDTEKLYPWGGDDDAIRQTTDQVRAIADPVVPQAKQYRRVLHDPITGSMACFRSLIEVFPCPVGLDRTRSHDDSTAKTLFVSLGKLDAVLRFSQGSRPLQRLTPCPLRAISDEAYDARLLAHIPAAWQKWFAKRLPAGGQCMVCPHVPGNAEALGQDGAIVLAARYSHQACWVQCWWPSVVCPQNIWGAGPVLLCVGS